MSECVAALTRQRFSSCKFVSMFLLFLFGVFGCMCVHACCLHGKCVCVCMLVGLVCVCVYICVCVCVCVRERALYSLSQHYPASSPGSDGGGSGLI